jgi:hypothetical protein
VTDSTDDIIAALQPLLRLLLRGVTAEYTVGVGRRDAEDLVRILQHLGVDSGKLFACKDAQ